MIGFFHEDEGGGPAETRQRPPFSVRPLQAFAFFAPEDFFVAREGPRVPFDETFSARVVGPLTVR
jgi:hypothetical protein